MGPRFEKIKQHKKKILLAVIILIAIALAAKYGGDPKQWMGKARAFAEEGWTRSQGNVAKFKQWAKQFIAAVKHRRIGNALRASNPGEIGKYKKSASGGWVPARRKSRKSRKRKRGPSRRKRKSKKSRRRRR